MLLFKKLNLKKVVVVIYELRRLLKQFSFQPLFLSCPFCLIHVLFLSVKLKCVCDNCVKYYILQTSTNIKINNIINGKE